MTYWWRWSLTQECRYRWSTMQLTGTYNSKPCHSLQPAVSRLCSYTGAYVKVLGSHKFKVRYHNKELVLLSTQWVEVASIWWEGTGITHFSLHVLEQHSILLNKQAFTLLTYWSLGLCLNSTFQTLETFSIGCSQLGYGYTFTSSSTVTFHNQVRPLASLFSLCREQGSSCPK